MTASGAGRPTRVVVAITGASGSIYGIRTLQLLRELGAGGASDHGPGSELEIHLLMTAPARATLAVETEWSPIEVEELADVVHPLRDMGASIASGSFPTAGMIVAPCSIKTLSAIAHSYSVDLVGRAADVALKERRPLVLLVRETPFHLGHLRLMTQVTEMGGIIHPPVPAFYNQPRSIADLVDHTVGRALEHLGLHVPHLRRWEGG
jgi:4-hydroxy-3-polyprenylbenzoate decarboxylase